jgi:hypothetical protein
MCGGFCSARRTLKPSSDQPNKPKKYAKNQAVKIMNHCQKRPPPIVRHPAYRRAFERLDEVLEKKNTWDNSAKIAAMRLAYFADVDEFEKTHKMAIPKKMS